MKYIKEIVGLLVLFLLIGNVTAEESYDVTLTISRPNNVNDIMNTSWSEYDTITIDKHERVDCVYDIMVEDVAMGSETVMIEVLEDGERLTLFLKLGESGIFEFENSESPPIKVTVDALIEGGSSDNDGSVASSDDDVVRVWVSPNSIDELSLTTNPAVADAYNPSEFGKTSGWSGSGSIEFVALYIERMQEISGITINIAGGDWDEINVDNDDIRKFELNENAVYTITVDYEERDVWGGVTDEREIYILSINGLIYGINTNPGVPLDSSTFEDKLFETFNAKVNVYTIVETETQGTWEEVDGAIIKFDGETTAGAFSWKVKFDAPGTKEVGYKETSGLSGQYKFVVAAETPAPAATVVAQQTTTDNETSSGTVIAIFGILILIGAAAVFMNKKNREKKGGNGSVRISPELPA